MVVPESQDKMYYPPDDLQKDAHVSDFNSYLALYRKSLENPEGRSNTAVSAMHAVVSCISTPSEPPCIQCLLMFICPICSLQLLTWITLFQFSGKRLLMSSSGRNPQQAQCWSTTLMSQKETYMLNSWKGPKPTYAIMSWTGMWGRGTSLKRLPITGKQQCVQSEWWLWGEILPGVTSGISVNSSCCVLCPCCKPSAWNQTSFDAIRCECFSLLSE